MPGDMSHATVHSERSCCIFAVKASKGSSRSCVGGLHLSGFMGWLAHVCNLWAWGTVQGRGTGWGHPSECAAHPAQGPWVPVSPSSHPPVALDGGLGWTDGDLGWSGAWGGWMETWAGRGPGWRARAVLAPGADEGTGSPLQSRACPQPSELLEGSRAHSRSRSSTGPPGPPTPTPASAAGGLQRRSRRVRVLPWRPVPRPCGELVILISSCSLSGPLKLKAPPPNPHTPPE